MAIPAPARRTGVSVTDARALTASELTLQFAAALPGSLFLYHVGDLAADRRAVPGVAARAGVFMRTIIRGSGQSRRLQIMGFAVEGRCELVQVRLGAARRAYYARKVRR